MLPVDFKNAEYDGLRKYRQIDNGDGTVSFQDVTDYRVVGSTFGDAEINATNQAINEATQAIAAATQELSGKASTDVATASAAGLMSAEDFTKLSGIEAGAQTRIGSPVYISATAPSDTTGLWVVPPT